MASLSKKKGNHNERNVAAAFEYWWGGIWKRMPMSGGLRWNAGIFTYGDIVPPENFRGILECKHYSDVQLDALLRVKKADKSGIKESYIACWWYEQLESDYQRALKETGHHFVKLLIWKQNNRQHQLVLDGAFWDKLVAVAGYTDDQPPQVNFMRIHIPGYQPIVNVVMSQFHSVFKASQFAQAADEFFGR